MVTEYKADKLNCHYKPDVMNNKVHITTQIKNNYDSLTNPVRIIKPRAKSSSQPVLKDRKIAR